MGNACGNRLLSFKEIAEIPHACTHVCAHTHMHTSVMNKYLVKIWSLVKRF